MTATVKSIGNALADTVNPFTRLVITATTDDGAAGVPYFQSEKVKEAAAQSDYGCESVYKAIMQRIESKSVVVQFKCLSLIRTLMIEGPAAFGTKVSMNQSRFFTLAQLHDVRKDSLEAHVKQLAQNIQDACNGKSGALLRPVGDADTTHNLASGTAMSNARAKSDFQEAQEREAKAFRKKREEEKKAAEMVTTDKHFDTYDCTLPAARLVAAAVQSTKKKLAMEELCNFHEAITKHVKPADVVAALDACLRDIKESMQNKFKALAIIEHIVVTVPYHDAIVYFKTATQGLSRMSQLQATPDAPKAATMAMTAATILRVLSTCIVPPPHVRGEPVARPAAMPSFAANTAAHASQHTPATQNHSYMATGVNPAFATPSFDDLAVKTHRARATSRGPSTAPQPTRPQQSQQPDAGWGTWPTAPTQPQQQPPLSWGAPQPQQQQQQFPAAVVAPAPSSHVDPADAVAQMQLQMQQQMAMMAGMMAQIQAQNAAAPAPSGPSSRSESVSSHATAAFVATPAAAAPVWQSSVAAPPPLREPSAAPAAMLPSQAAPVLDGYGAAAGRMRSDSTFSDSMSPPSVPNNTIVTPMAGLISAAGNGSFNMSVTSGLASPAEPAPSPVSASQSRTGPPAFTLNMPIAPPAAAVSLPVAAPQQQQQLVTLEMLQKLQAQMKETESILARQQAMYDRMRQQFIEQQEAQMKAFQALQSSSA